MASTFYGGIHPKENKWYAEHVPVEAFPEPDLLVIPMSQHIGAPCTPLVKKGDPVTVGQKIGDGQGLCAPVHASVSGVVKAVEARPHAGGTMLMSVVIENDHLDTLCPEVQPRTPEQVEALTSDELLQIIREAGIVGMGGAAFPTHVKLSSGVGKVDTVIVNVSECEPYIVADDRLCQEYPQQMLEGLRLVMKLLQVDRGFIAVENNKQVAAAALENYLKEQTAVSLKLLPAKYPQGAEKQLIQAVTGRQIPSGGLPAAVGCAVFNAATCKAVYDAVYDGMPLVRRIVTVSGDILETPKNFMTPIGTTYTDLINAAGLKENPYKVISGGPMMGVAQYELNVPVTKGSNAITVLGKKNRYAVADPHCIRCGKCMDVCPMRLMPLMLYQAEQSRDVEGLKKLDIMDCIECGCCAYTCPATIPLVQAFRTAKQRVRDQK